MTSRQQGSNRTRGGWEAVRILVGANRQEVRTESEFERSRFLGTSKDDGTGYGDFAQMNGQDRAPDWVDANTQNFDQGSVSKLYWGNTLTALDCPEFEMLAATGGGTAEVVIAGAENMAGYPFVILASSSGDDGFNYLDAHVPLSYDSVTDWFVKEAESEGANAGSLDAEGIGRVSLAVPTTSGAFGPTIWLAAVVWSPAGKPVLITNALQLTVDWQ